MFRNLLLTILLACACASAQTAPVPAASALPAHVFSVIGTFERVEQGWRCKTAGDSRPPLLRDLQIGDVLLSIDGESLSASTAIGLLQQLRSLEFGLTTEVEVARNGQRLKWTSGSTLPQIIAAQHSLKVLRSEVPGIHQGDSLDAIGQATFTAILAQIDNPLTALANVEVRAGKVLRVSRDGRPLEVTAEKPAIVRLVQFDLDVAQQVPQTVRLRGLNTADATLAAFRGRWTFLHFWATWCAPCIRHLPDMRELAQQPNLAVAAIGFADSEDRLSAAGAQEKALKVYAPDLMLQRELAITGIPFDVLLDPNGNAVLVISGDMPGDRLKDVVMRYIRE